MPASLSVAGPVTWLDSSPAALFASFSSPQTHSFICSDSLDAGVIAESKACSSFPATFIISFFLETCQIDPAESYVLN